MQIELLPKTEEAKAIIAKYGAVCNVLTHGPDHPILIAHVQYPNEQRTLDREQFQYAVIRD